MRTLLQFDFAFDGPWGEDLQIACRDLADDIAAQPGLIWKLWVENRSAGRAGASICSRRRKLPQPMWSSIGRVSPPSA